MFNEICSRCLKPERLKTNLSPLILDIQRHFRRKTQSAYDLLMLTIATPDNSNDYVKHLQCSEHHMCVPNDAKRCRLESMTFDRVIHYLCLSLHRFTVKKMACISMLLRSSSSQHASDFTHWVYLGYISDDRNSFHWLT